MTQLVDYKGIGAKVLSGIELDAKDWEGLQAGSMLVLQKHFANVRPADREDASQEILVQVFRKLDSFLTADCEFTTWFYNHVRTIALRWVRSAKMEKRAGKDGAVNTVSMIGNNGEQWFDADSGDKGLQTLENQEIIGTIRARLEQHDDCRLVTVLDMMGDGYKGVEIAQRLDTSPQRVEQLQHTIRGIACAVA